MKKILFALALILLLPMLSWAVDPSVVTVTYTNVNEEVSTITWAWTAQSDNGAVTSTACTSFKGWVFMATTDPGSPAPQAAYDITLSDSDGVDIFNAELTNRSASDSEQAIPKTGSAYYGARFINGALTMALSGNNVGGAKGALKIYYYREH